MSVLDHCIFIFFLISITYDLYGKGFYCYLAGLELKWFV